jgi:ATP-dependent helicase/nuclease subunit B
MAPSPHAIDAIAQNDHGISVLDQAMGRVALVLRDTAVDAARTVVLVPYAQLMPQAQRAWIRQAPQGFVPRFETTLNWSQRLGGFAPSVDDLSFDAARDVLTAQAWLARAGLGAQRDLLASRLMDAAWQIAPMAAAVAPDLRADWVTPLRQSLAGAMDAPALVYEAAVARLALEWAGASGYATDVLFGAALLQDTSCLVVLEGFQADPLAQALVQRLGDRAHVLPLLSAVADQPALAHVRLQCANGPEDEAEQAAACVVQHLDAGRRPVALAATDRVLTRRIRAMLGARGLRIRDETGWKLSTTRAAAQLMVALRACAWHATPDAVLDWLKHSPAWPAPTVRALEKTLRDQGLRDWRAVVVVIGPSGDEGDVAQLVQHVQALRERFQAARPLSHWLHTLRDVLQASGQWPALVEDVAGEAVLEALRLGADEGAASPAEWDSLPQAARRMEATEFMGWVRDALEAASFKAGHPQSEHVVILPFPQMLGQQFAAAVLPGCDELNLPGAPEPAGSWTATQRTALGLPARQVLQGAQQAAWQQALTVPYCDVLWRRADAAGEPVLPSPLVQHMQQRGQGTTGHDARTLREVAAQPVDRPQPRGDALPLAKLSASAYEDLRRCPYRFFALRQLGLRESDELESELDKRDFGNWLHAVLRHFHEAMATASVPHGPARQALLDATADAEARRRGLGDEGPLEGEFLPFAAGWPGLRDGYLNWLAGHEAEGVQFVSAEVAQDVPLGQVNLIGRLDRIDRDGQGMTMVLDYKTEGLQVTRERVKRPAEDTQIAFYAALMHDDTLRAAYVNVGERETRTVEQTDVVHARDLLVEGLREDMAAVADGAPLPALGEGRACDYCAARGLCRKDFWKS